MYVIYLVVNNVNRKVYVGKTRRSVYIRWSDHIRRANNGAEGFFPNAIRKYGKESFSAYGIDFAEDNDSACCLEKYYISEFNSHCRSFGYNGTAGGEGRETFDPDMRKAISDRLRGHTMSKESKDRISRAAKERIRLNGHPRGMLGRHPSEETRRRLSEAHKGKPCSAETRQKQKFTKAATRFRKLELEKTSRQYELFPKPVQLLLFQ